MSDQATGSIAWGIGLPAAIVAFMITVSWCVSSSNYGHERAESALIADGYTDIVITRFKMWGCDGAMLSTKFAARSPAGVPVEGDVCCGVIWRGCSIRTDR